MGIALVAHGGGITAEAADVVVLADDVGRVPEAIRIGRRTLRVAKQSIWVGLGLSATAMVVASLGYIPPAVGALLQEAIDVAVILNALRTSRDPDPTDRSATRRTKPGPMDMPEIKPVRGADRETAHTARSHRERVVLSLLAFAGLVVSATGAVALLVSAVTLLAHRH